MGVGGGARGKVSVVTPREQQPAWKTHSLGDILVCHSLFVFRSSFVPRQRSERHAELFLTTWTMKEARPRWRIAPLMRHLHIHH